MDFLTIIFILMGFLSGWFMMHGMIVPFGQYHSSGTVWGCKFQGKGNGRYWLMALAGFLLLVLWFVLVLSNEDFMDTLFPFLIAFLVGIGFSFYTWIRVRNQCYASNNISSAIVNVAFMPDLERYAAQCHHFELAANGIAFYNEANYCIGQIIFTDYQLGNVPNNEIVFACYGLAQKFHGVFTCHIEDRNVGRDSRTDTVITERHYTFRRK